MGSKKRPSKQYIGEMTWEEKAKVNPLYGVMSEERFAESGAQPTEEEYEQFYARGHEMVRKWILPWMQETNTDQSMKVMEFGCGMGRLTNALAQHHPAEMIGGTDISATMIDHANQRAESGINHGAIRDDGSFPFEDEEFDRIYSYAVFQHISTRSVVERSIEQISRVLKPGGFVRLNFEMIFPPPFANPLKQDTFAFEDSYLVYGMKKIGGVPVPGAYRNKSNNWTGIRLGYRQLLKKLASVGIDIYGIAQEPGTKGFVWFYGKKRS